MHKEIGGIVFTAVRIAGHQVKWWQAKVASTGQLLPQHYHTRDRMWDDLSRFARMRATFGDECLAYRQG